MLGGDRCYASRVSAEAQQPEAQQQSIEAPYEEKKQLAKHRRPTSQPPKAQ
jgi:hypothetical protein